MDQTPSIDRLSRWHRLGLWALFGFLVVFGVVTEWRAAYMQTRKGDQEIYLWTAYAVRAGENIYDVEDSHGWHYVYPPLFAILMAPLAEKPPDHPVDLWTLPFPVSVGLWYVLSVGFLVLAVQGLAGALEEAAGPAVQRGGRRWWALRLLPVLVCLPPIAHTLMRGQTNLLLLALIAGMASATLRGRPWRAGFCLAGAICLKLIPAFLLLFPLWRRDGRCLAGCAIGLLIGMAAVPAAVFGPKRTLTYYEDFAGKVILPGLGEKEDKSRERELIAMDATHSQSFVAAIHGAVNLGRRTTEAAPAVRALHWLLAALLTGLTLWSAGWRRAASGLDAVLLLGCLTLLMILSSPVCHTHYFALGVPVVMGLLAAWWDGEESPSSAIGWKLLLGLYLLVHLLMLLPGMEGARDLGLGLYPALLLLLAAMRVLYRRREAVASASSRLRIGVGFLEIRRNVGQMQTRYPKIKA